MSSRTTAMDRRAFIALTSMAAAASGATAVKQGKIVAAQIGTGHSHAPGKMRAMRDLADLYQVIGICEPDEALWKRNGGSKAYADLPRLTLEEVLFSEAELVAVETLIGNAPEMGRRCLEAGKHIHLDKPGALTHREFREMRMLAEEKKLHLQMGYMLRYNPAFQLLTKAHREGWLGTITGIDASMGKLAGESLRKELGELPGGGMFELACHLTDMVVALLGKPKEVRAFGTPTRDDGFEDNQLATLAYPKAVATIRCNHADPFGGPHRRFQVTGTKGSMEISPLESGKLILSLTDDHPPHKKGRHTLELDVPAGRYDSEFRDMAEAINTGRPLAWDAAHDIGVHETVLRSAGIDPN